MKNFTFSLANFITNINQSFWQWKGTCRWKWQLLPVLFLFNSSNARVTQFFLPFITRFTTILKTAKCRKISRQNTARSVFNYFHCFIFCKVLYFEKGRINRRELQFRSESLGLAGSFNVNYTAYSELRSGMGGTLKIIRCNLSCNLWRQFGWKGIKATFYTRRRLSSGFNN